LTTSSDVPIMTPFNQFNSVIIDIIYKHTTNMIVIQK
jgi:hypothetical protein